MTGLKQCVIFFFLSSVVLGQNTDLVEFDNLSNRKNWQLTFNDNCLEDWKSKWFLDGLKAKIKNTDQGMVFSAGPTVGDDSCHAVLWSKASFKGDVKIEYEYTKLDSQKSQVNILYIQATGVAPFGNDIEEWNDYRVIPHMKTYFDNMNCLHISYAAFDKEGKDYIRVRKYPRHAGSDFNSTTEIPPAHFNTGLFISGKTYKVTVIKAQDKLWLHVKDENETKLFSWNLDTSLSVNEGRIGLRHMYTRSSLYKNFKVYTQY